MQNLIVISGVANNINIVNNILSMTVTHTVPGTDPAKAPRVSVFEVEANNGTAKWAEALPLREAPRSPSSPIVCTRCRKSLMAPRPSG